MYYQNILERLVERSRELLGSGLTGIYLHGSMAMGCFQPEKSDIDLILVIGQDMTEEQKLSFMTEVVRLNESAPAKGIELSVVKREYCDPFVYPTPFELHFSSMHLAWFRRDPLDYVRRMNGTDKDLAAHFTIIKKYGIVLYGAPVDEVFAEVPRESYIDSIWYDIEGAEEEILEDPVYIILNLCRITAFLQDGLVISKKQGGEWGLEKLPPEYQKLIREALQCYAAGTEMKPEKAEAQKFSNYMLRKIEKYRNK